MIRHGVGVRMVFVTLMIAFLLADASTIYIGVCATGQTPSMNRQGRHQHTSIDMMGRNSVLHHTADPIHRSNSELEHETKLTVATGAFLGTSYSQTVDIIILAACGVGLLFLILGCWCMCSTTQKYEEQPIRSSQPAALLPAVTTAHPHYQPYSAYAYPAQPVHVATSYRTSETLAHESYPQQLRRDELILADDKMRRDAAASASTPIYGYDEQPIVARGLAYSTITRPITTVRDEPQPSHIPISDFGVPLPGTKNRYGEDAPRTLANWTRDSN